MDPIGSVDVLDPSLGTRDLEYSIEALDEVRVGDAPRSVWSDLIEVNRVVEGDEPGDATFDECLVHSIGLVERDVRLGPGMVVDLDSYNSAVDQFLVIPAVGWFWVISAVD
jgi:hypothetical protein